ncbi:hypothetical protein ES703_115076 [subsurface metagenome]
MTKRREKVMTIQLTTELEQLLDEYCQELDLNRSELIQKSLNHFLAHLQTGAVKESFLDRCEREGFDFAKIISELIRSYVEESEVVRIEAKPPTKAEGDIVKLEWL